MSSSKHHKRVASDGPDDPSDPAKEPRPGISHRGHNSVMLPCSIDLWGRGRSREHWFSSLTSLWPLVTDVATAVSVYPSWPVLLHQLGRLLIYKMQLYETRTSYWADGH